MLFDFLLIIFFLGALVTLEPENHPQPGRGSKPRSIQDTPSDDSEGTTVSTRKVEVGHIVLTESVAWLNSAHGVHPRPSIQHTTAGVLTEYLPRPMSTSLNNIV